MSNLVKVYSWTRYNTSTDGHTPSAYLGTLEAIEAARGVAQLETERLVSSSWLDENAFYRGRRLRPDERPSRRLCKALSIAEQNQKSSMHQNSGAPREVRPWLAL